MQGKRCPRVVIEAHPEFIKCSLVCRMITIDNCPGCALFHLRRDCDRNTVFIGAANEEHISLLRALIAYIHICWKVRSCKMTEVNISVGIWQRRCYQNAIEVLFHNALSVRVTRRSNESEVKSK